VPDLSRYAQIS